MGFNDYEIPACNEIIESVQLGKILPQEGIDKIRKIMDSKQNYH